jgi:hypothetical protein
MGGKRYWCVRDQRHMPSQDSHMGGQNQGDLAMREEMLAEMRPLRQSGSICWNTSMGWATWTALGPAK